ncbi:MAG: YcaO-like family protein, partial [Hyphomicrobiales bacterium]
LTLSVNQGKGLTREEARTSAIMEAVEYFCAEQTPNNRRLESRDALQPRQFVLPKRSLRRRLAPRTAIPWVPGRDLMSGRSVLVPEELVRLDFRMPRPEHYGWFHSTSNGLAAGNTLAEASLHALCELIERDAFSLWLQAPAECQAARRVDATGIAEPRIAWLLRRYLEAKIAIEVWDTTSDLGVPSFFCLIDDRNGRPPHLGRSGGNGCHPCAPVALCRALCEAAQSRLTLIAGARDDITPEHYAMASWAGNLASLFSDRAGPSRLEGTAAPAPSIDTATIDGDLAAVLERLANSGIDRVVAVDLSHSSLPVAAVRIVIPELEGMQHKAGYKPGRRAREAARRWS